MDNDLKFRVWDRTDKKMLFFKGIFNKEPYTETSTFVQYESFLVYHDLKTMRCSDVTDIHGNLMYEDDIVEYVTKVGYNTVFKNNAVISFKDGKLYPLPEKITCEDSYYNYENYDFEVTGNIWENLVYHNKTIK